MSKAIVLIIVYIFEMLNSFCYFSRIYEKKKENILIALLIGFLLFIPSSIIFYVFDNEIVNTIMFFIINAIYAFVCFDISLKNAAIQSVILNALMVSTEYATVFLCSVIIQVPTNQYKNDIHIFIIYALICKLAYFILSQFLSLIIIKTGHKNNKLRHFLPLFVFPILTMASSILFLFTALKNAVSDTYKITAAIVCILYILSSVFIFIYYQTLANKETKINELESEKRLYNLNNTYLNILQHQNNELQMMFHDTKHHYMALSNFDNIDDVKSYIAKIYPELEAKNIIKVSNNKMLDLIISKYIVACKSNDIKFDYEVKTANLDYIDDAELSILLNNILDNAVEAAKNSSERYIEFSLRHIKNNMDLLSVVNSCDHSPKHNNRQLITTKFDTDNHGFGTKIIKKHAKKNNGKYEWFYDDTEHRFHLTILFQKNTKSGTV